MKVPDLSIVIPVYNEGASIESVLRSVQSSVATPHEIVVVYDFDEDNTLPVVRSLQIELPQLRLHRNELGRGVLQAVRSGMAASRAPFVLVTMADDSDDHRIVDNMVALGNKGAAVVAASRYAPGGTQVGGPRWKAWCSRAAGLSLYHLGGLSVHDPTNNFKLYAKWYLDSVEIESDRGFEFALELTVKAHARGLPLAEIPTTWRGRAAGDSQFHARKLLPGYVRWYVYGLKAWRQSNRRPVLSE